MNQPSNRIRYAALTFILATAALTLAPAAHGQAPTPAHNHSIVEWYADLTGAKDSSLLHAEAVQTKATGKALVSFDFDHQTATFTVEAKDLVGVQKIEVRTTRTRGDLSGPALLTIYDSHDGPFTGTATKTVSGPTFNHVATPITNDQASVVIYTEAHPAGEIAGTITMHKRYYEQ